MMILCLIVVFAIVNIFDWQNPFFISRQFETVAVNIFNLFWIEKLLNFVDTLFIVLKAQYHRLSFLHVGHHASMALNMFLLDYLHANYGCMLFPILLNSLVHTFMFAYYLFKTNWLKIWVTRTQILQLILCMIHGIIMFWFETSLPFSKSIGVIQSLYMFGLIILFLKFYRSTYNNKEQTSLVK
jgi:elongation of very long chain fatty acids protein 4